MLARAGTFTAPPAEIDIEGVGVWRVRAGGAVAGRLACASGQPDRRLDDAGLSHPLSPPTAKCFHSRVESIHQRSLKSQT